MEGEYSLLSLDHVEPELICRMISSVSLTLLNKHGCNLALSRTTSSSADPTMKLAIDRSSAMLVSKLISRCFLTEIKLISVKRCDPSFCSPDSTETDPLVAHRVLLSREVKSNESTSLEPFTTMPISSSSMILYQLYVPILSLFWISS